MTPSYPPALLQSFEDLSRVVFRADSPQEVYDDVCRQTVRIVDGCDHASLMLRRRGGASGEGAAYTAGSSDETAAHSDRLELAIGEGPCLDVLRDDEPEHHFCPDLRAASASRWPALAERLVEETPVRGVAGFRVRVDDEAVGALNIFSRDPRALTEDSMAQAAVIAAFVSVALQAVRNGQERDTLRRGLDSNRIIGKAVGLLMSSQGLTDDEAFDVLARLSQEMNVKLAQLATDVVAQHHRGLAEAPAAATALPPGPAADPSPAQA
ncbi:GAF domain-containing protein [Nocardioides scoriae]|uniref:GAF domain-containing protein n=1 Tax=Nocardioides scoriae TaxID=642780 RepID=A0A1H1NZB6_9ACTN|nr:GAF and ANTAR domain-containing protein [Nocardioides scoriae]SDS04293.1 GAF domain-containing protein [Nocardioides scoriae]